MIKNIKKYSQSTRKQSDQIQSHGERGNKASSLQSTYVDSKGGHTAVIDVWQACRAEVATTQWTYSMPPCHSSASSSSSSLSSSRGGVIGL